jgi:GNAT superfamily N-acetyltransferase
VYVTSELEHHNLPADEIIDVIPVKGKIPDKINNFQVNQLKEVPVHKNSVKLNETQSDVYYSITAEPIHIDKIAEIYDEIHTAKENGEVTIGWIREIYPTRKTAEASVEKGDMFVEEDNGIIVAAAKINKEQVDVYEGAGWEYPAPDEEVMVLHTLVVSPKVMTSGIGREFVNFYEEFARQNGCPYLRMDTNERNERARAFYKKVGYKEIDIVPCIFNGIEGVNLVLLEKRL